MQAPPSNAKYRYNKQAGALNEIAGALEPARPAPERASRFSGSATLHAQSVSAAPVVQTLALENDLLQANVDPHTGRLIPPPPPHTAAARGAPRMRGGAAPREQRGLDHANPRRRQGMFFYTVEDGQRVRAISKDGSVEILSGPCRVWRSGRRFEPMAHYVAHPGEFLIVRFRDGRQEHLPGPSDVWLDSRVHLDISKEDALQIAAKEAVVVYSATQQNAEPGHVSRRIVHGPATFVPAPGEWLHTFSWHGSQGGHKGYQKVPNGLVFQKLWLMPDQMYHDVQDVRTADDAVLTVRLMLFFELLDIEKMLETSHDPIGDFVNAATSDVIDFTARLGFDEFKRNTDKLNDLQAYRQLTARAEQCGYRLTKVVYRGYGAPESLQRMHDEAIESRTKLQLERATEEQSQELEDARLERSLARQRRERAEQDAQVSHEIDIHKRRADAARAEEEAGREAARRLSQLDAEQELALQKKRQEHEQTHLDALRGLGVDLTQLLTQNRADQVLEVRGSSGTHLHLSPTPKK